MQKAVVFDLNGIFLTSPLLSDRIAQDFAVPQEIFIPELSRIMDIVRQPNVGPAFAYWEPVLKSWGITLGEDEFWNYWFSAEKPNDQVIELAINLRKNGWLVLILSNNFKERTEYYESFPWFTEVADKAYFSWRTGFVKPDPDAWRLVLKDNDLEAKACWYFDDQQKNVDVAKSLGLQAEKFTDVTQVRSVGFPIG